MKVVAEETQGRSGKHKTQERHGMASGRKIRDGDGYGGNRGDACSQAVQDVDDVQGVRHRQDPQHRQGNRDPNRQKRELDVGS